MLKILHEDKWLVVCIKPDGVLSEEFGRGRCMPELLKKQVKAYKIGVVHRLDKPVSGVMVFSKHRDATAALSKQIADRSFEKEYLCVCRGCPTNKTGEMRDYLFRDKAKNKTFVVKTLRKGVKEAFLTYETLQTITTGDGELSLVKIKLGTGRTHQIRVQFASRKMPILGDEKYGFKADCKLALFSHRLAFRHPAKKEIMEFSEIPQNGYPWNKFDLSKFNINTETL